MSLIERLKTQRESVEQDLQNIEEHAKELAEIAAKAIKDKHEKLREIADLAKAIAVLDTHEEELALEWVEPLTTEEVTEAAESVTDQPVDDAVVEEIVTEEVTDPEPEVTDPEAAYAPVNEQPLSNALMWAFGIEADAEAKAKAKAAEPEAKRPFWMLGKVDA
jgi:hypothetical protein